MGESIRAEDGVGAAIHHFYHDLLIARERLKGLQEAKNTNDIYRSATVSFRNDNHNGNDNDDNKVGCCPSETSSTCGDSSKAPLPHAASMQPDGHPPPKGTGPKKEFPFRNRLKPSATKPSPDYSLARFDSGSKSAEDMLPNSRSMQLRLPDDHNTVRLAHDGHPAPMHSDQGVLCNKTVDDDKLHNTSRSKDKRDEDESDSDGDGENLVSHCEGDKAITIEKTPRALETIKSKMHRLKEH